jgi:AraC family transcriptional regulator
VKTILRQGDFYGRALAQQNISDLVLVYSEHVGASRLPRHSHEHAYFNVIDDGMVQEDYGRRQRICAPGMVIFHPPGESHRQTHHVRVAALNVEIGGTWLHRFGELGHALDRPAEFREGRVARAGLQILREFLAPDRDSALAIECLTWEILAASSACNTDTNRPGPGWVVEARELLDSRLDEAPTLGSLAKAVGIHPVHFAAVFRRIHGCSVGEYSRRRRLDHARQRLAETDLSLAQVATEAGFADQSHMTRVFKRFLGLTPREYRTFLAFKKS